MHQIKYGRFQKVKNKKEHMLNAIRLWSINNGLEEITDNESYYFHTDVAFKKDGKITGFILKFDKDDEQLMLKMVSSRILCDYIYVVTDDNSRNRKEISDKIMDEYGMLCYSDSFGLGYVYQVFKEPKNIIK